MIHRAAASLLLAACGPSIPLDDDESTSDATTTTSQTGATSLTTSTSATTATTQPTTVSTTAMGDESTSSDSTTGDDDVRDETGLQYIENPDGGNLGGSDCDVWAQDCAPGDKCLPWANDGGNAWNATRCSPLHPAPAGIGEPCHVEGGPYSGVDDCALGAMCWGVDPTTLIGECVPICDGSEANPMCGDGTSCLIAFEGTVNLCLPNCDPFASECGDGTECVGAILHAPLSFVCLPVPPFQPHGYGEPCQHIDVCDGGLLCVDAEHVPGCADFGCCTIVGESAAPPVCPDEAQTCIPLDDAMPLDGLCYCGVEA